jgi:competence protein ComGC
MNNEKLKKELHTLIDNTEDEELLNMVKEDIIAYQTESKKEFDDLSDLTPEQRAELEESINEDPEKDTISQEEFNAHIESWKQRLLSTRKGS